MSKSKNTSAHNRAFKAHKNGITRVTKHVYRSKKGMNPKERRNALYSLRGSQQAEQERRDALMQTA